MSGQYKKAGIEPSLTEVMADEVIHLVMRRDRLSPDAVWAHVETARAGLRSRVAQPERRCA